MTYIIRRVRGDIVNSSLCPIEVRQGGAFSWGPWVPLLPDASYKPGLAMGPSTVEVRIFGVIESTEKEGVLDRNEISTQYTPGHKIRWAEHAAKLSTAALVEFMSYENAWIKMKAVQACGQRRPEEALIAKLKTLCDDDPCMYVRDLAKESLSVLEAKRDKEVKEIKKKEQEMAQKQKAVEDQAELWELKLPQATKENISKRCSQRTVVLISSPDESIDGWAHGVLSKALRLKTHGLRIVAGSAGDQFHQVILTEGGWKKAWLGKVEAAIQMAPDACFVTVKGGPQCDFEREELKRFQGVHKGMQVEHFESLEDLMGWFNTPDA